MPKLIDMTGWKMWEHGVPDSRLTVIKRWPENDTENKPLWLCKCQCGTELIVRGKHLRNGNTKSCSCLQKDKVRITGYNNIKNLVGEKIGYLTVLERAENKGSTSNVIWKCLCECGNICYVSSGNLGRSVGSCGCKRMSIGEQNIINFLSQNNYNYIHDKIYFKDLLSIHGNPCRYDFIIFNENNQPYWLIEFDGRQHNEEMNSNFFHQSLQEIQANDEIKNRYAIEHNIPLVRIPYSQRNKITQDILFGDKYLLKEFKT